MGKHGLFHVFVRLFGLMVDKELREPLRESG